ncbi:hypothetical protein BZARG_383 [Bizionia argentinensis JUB59]|uniref:Fibronectin type-III domain-containing protein n=1 Tax=Bizionia argentinensis JUB59 TaxID=1046627 RepID=G2EGZ6_9FLAO|nr:hypothetical protein [Bizionia argentinensis]EGV42230.1 hypothetical protein BZARG_383 [Bizionia argentinensis JUB59]
MKKGLYLIIVLVAFNCSEIIEVENISNNTISILAPTDTSVLTEANVQFSWNLVEDAERYKLQIATPNFQNTLAIKEDTIITATSFSKSLNSGNYEWRVRAENSDYHTKYATQGFSVLESDAVNISNEDIILLAPANSIIFNTTDTINFSWETILNAENYTIQIATPNFANALEIIENETVNTTSFSISNMDAQGYEWRVKARNLEYETAYTIQSFTVEE